MEILKGLDPEVVFKYFEEISAIPRGSGNEGEIADYIMNFAKERGLEAIKDEHLNVIVYKPAALGYEDSPKVAIQGHTDMVCEQNQGTNHNFLTDPIKLVVDGDWISAEGTTLGADDGIAVAKILALLDGSYPHPALAALFTSGEEIGLLGAMAMDAKYIEGYKYFLNLDGGTFIVSCAGGILKDITIPIEYKPAPRGNLTYTLKVRGLRGGHSGGDINKGYGHSNRLMGRLLYGLSTCATLVQISGGAKTNAIPREADAVINFPEDSLEEVKAIVRELEDYFKNEHKRTEPNLKIVLEESPGVSKVFTEESTAKIVTALLLLPNGIQSLSQDFEGVTECSNNIGVVKTEGDKVIISTATRSSVDSLKFFVDDQINHVASIVGGNCRVCAIYPAWEYNPDSKLQEISKKVHKELFNENLKIHAIHGGLEGGVYVNKVPGIDVIAYGPHKTGVHSPDERLSISSTKRSWDFTLKLLEELK